ncbi:hypothetical protein RT99_02205 [Flavobacterium sp. MEB061]|uniref:AAA family ATPase n=1 Tax=Flavobacterium sp. MEB061 TaxID=1587524 RepID=UPI0005ACF3FE|nr:AAA family ATPase [Flavobacterium sp. MEB061]KIQ24914.1 hypothetical protein RT99_02205 [Flavobacterium sp. MEB061]
MDKKNINNFQIIAIKALPKCSDDFTKILEKDKLYYFYQNYEIKKIKRVETIIQKNKESYPESLFDIKGENGDISINVSAIVGKNGCGKSSIIDLLFRAINNIAYNFKYVKDDKHKTITADLKVVMGIHVEFYFFTDKFYKIVVEDEKYEVFNFDNKGRIIQKSNKYFFSLEDFFYTEAVNYSHYAYNSNEFGFIHKSKFIDWLKELFHKNDSYQTPLVLNPMRTNGDFEIARENELVKQRILGNLLRPIKNGNVNFRKIGDNLIATNLSLKLKPIKNNVEYWDKEIKNKNNRPHIFDLSVFTTEERNYIVKILMCKIVNVHNFDLNIFSEKKYKTARSYIIYKLISICKKYDDYKDYLLPKHLKFDLTLFMQFIDKLCLDTSHITFKLKQTLNYLKNDYLNFTDNSTEITLNEVSKSIEEIRLDNQSILELIPPPIFEIEILLTPIIGNYKIIKFSSLSSGEKQQIYMVSSLLYHLSNLDSVAGDKIKYKNINIVLEEVELYFHPELQKTFIKYFLDSIARIELKNIKSINICFVTHSPFILSDIPRDNIMYLEIEKGKTTQIQKERKSFGANIHELLADNFFMSDGYIGAFAQFKINKTIEWLNDELQRKNVVKKQNESISFIYKSQPEELLYHKNLISLIDEPIVKIKLAEMLAEINSDEDIYFDALIDEQIKQLNNRRKIIKP